MCSIKDSNLRISDQPGAPVVVAPALALTDLKALAERAGEYAAHAQAFNTRTAYAKALRGFGHWCAGLGLPVLPDGLPVLPVSPGAVAAYLVVRADQGSAIASMALFRSALADAHTKARLLSPLSDPDLKLVWAGIKRTRGGPQRKAYPLSPRELRTMILAQRWGLKAVRDRCLMLLGFASAVRPEELVAIELEHLERLDDGRMLLTIPHSKGDQESQGQRVVIARGSDRITCPVSALDDWLAVAGISSGPLLLGLQYGRLTGEKLGPGDVSKVLKAAARRAGLPKSLLKMISGYSLRRGLATTARKQGRSLDCIQRQCRHRHLSTTLGYVAAEELALKECAAEGIGL